MYIYNRRVSPRPRQASDAEILAAALTAILRHGPVRLTLAHVAREAGLSPAALVQRFGSKRGLLLAVASGGPEGNAAIFTSLRERHASPVAALLGMADQMAMLGRTRTEIANSLAFLQIDLADPAFLKLAARSSAACRDGIRALVQDAIATGELLPCEPARLATALQAAMNGALLNWAVHGEGTLAATIRRDLETILTPRMRSPRAAATTRAARSRGRSTSRGAGRART
jgi:AcrR family transcriptional regulator